MSAHNDPNAGASREQARGRLRNLTRIALFATAGATVGIGIVVAHEHPGTGAAGTTTSGHSTGGSTAGSSGSTSSTGSTGNSGSVSTGNTGTSGGSSSSPSSTSQSPSVTSGGSSR